MMAGTSPGNPVIEMPRYKCHKEVWALKIKAILDNVPKEGQEWDRSCYIVPEEDKYQPFVVDGEYIEKHNPEIGGYYVVYADGYKSYSPA